MLERILESLDSFVQLDVERFYVIQLLCVRVALSGHLLSYLLLEQVAFGSQLLSQLMLKPCLQALLVLRQ
jgi:hypothetical protein